MALFGRRSKKGFSLIRVISAVLVLGFLVVVVAESAKYLYGARVPKSVSNKLEPSVNKLATVLGVARTSLGDLGDIFVADDENSKASKSKDIVIPKEQSEKEISAKPVAKIAVLADSHNDNDNLARALAKTKGLGADRAVFLGDYTDYGELDDLQKARDIMEASQIPYYSLPGDHDLAQTRDESNFTQVFGDTYGVIKIEAAGTTFKLVYFDNSKNLTKIGETQIAWFNKEVQAATVLFLSQPLVTRSMSRVMGIIDGVKDQVVFEQNLELLEVVRSSKVKVTVAGDLHQSSSFEDPKRSGLWHYTVGAVLKSQSLEKLNLQSPRFAMLILNDDLSYEIIDVPID